MQLEVVLPPELTIEEAREIASRLRNAVLAQASLGFLSRYFRCAAPSFRAAMAVLQFLACMP